MKYNLNKLDLEIYMKNLTIDSEFSNTEDIVDVVTRAVEEALYKYTKNVVSTDILHLEGLSFDKSEEDKKIRITDIDYDLYDEEIEERHLPSTIEISLGDINRSVYLNDSADLKSAIRTALNDYMVDHKYAKIHEQIVVDFYYEFVK